MFSFTRMGMYNTDPNWWDHNLALFEAITLPSMSQALHNPEDFWVMLVNKVSPIEAVRKLNTLIRNSPIRDKTYILYEDYISFWGSKETIYRDFVKQHVEPGEYFIKHQIDSDDAVAYDFFDRAREFVKEKTDEIGKESKFVFTFPHAVKFHLRDKSTSKYYQPFYSFNGFSYDNDCNAFPWIHQMFFSPQKNFFLTNAYSVFSIESDIPFSCYVSHGSSDVDLRATVWGWNRKGKDGDDSIFDSLACFGIEKDNVYRFLEKYPAPLKYYESRHTTEKPFNKSIKELKKELNKRYSWANMSLDYLDVGKSKLRKVIKKRIDNNKTWLENLSEFYEVECLPNTEYTKIKNGVEYLERLAASNHNYAIVYKGDKCFILYAVNGKITSLSDPQFCREKFTSSGKDDNQIWAKSIIENEKSMCSVEVSGLEYSMNLDGLNIVLLNDNKVADVVNINPNKNYRLKR